MYEIPQISLLLLSLLDLHRVGLLFKRLILIDLLQKGLVFRHNHVSSKILPEGKDESTLLLDLVQELLCSTYRLIVFFKYLAICTNIIMYRSRLEIVELFIGFLLLLT